MKINFALILLLTWTTFNLTAQIDTVYNLGNDENRITLDEIDQHIKNIEERLKNDTIEWIIRFEFIREEIEGDTLIQYGGINIVDQSILTEEDKIEIRLNYEIPKFNFVDINGETINSEDLKGKVIFINTWFTRCPPCIAEMPYLNEIKNNYSDQNIVFISMAPEEKREILTFLKKHHFQFQHIPDADIFLKKFGVGFPKNILVDKEGIIRYIGGGLVDGMIEKGEENVIEQDQVNQDVIRVQIDKLLSE